MRGATLVKEQVLKIRRELGPLMAVVLQAKADYAAAKARVAAEHDICIRHVNMIVRRKVWKDLYDEQQLFRKLDVKESVTPRRRTTCSVDC